MAINLMREQAVTVKQARREIIPQLNGKPVSRPTVYRWIDRGILAGDGSRVKLEAVDVAPRTVQQETRPLHTVVENWDELVAAGLADG